MAEASSAPQIKRMKLRREGTCACGQRVASGESAGWDRVLKVVVCGTCLEQDELITSASPIDENPSVVSTVSELEPPIDVLPEAVEVGLAGDSLKREYERRKAKREAGIREKHKRLGGLILALTDEPASTKAFAVGAVGEQKLAARLEKDCGESVLFLHNRKLGRGRRDGDIDHIAISSTGIHLIDAKRYPGSRVRVERSGGLFSPVREQLMIAGRDKSKLLDGCAKQSQAVMDALVGHPLAERVEVTSYLCFIESDLPIFGTQQMRGVHILGPKATVKALLLPGELTEEDRRSLHRHLAEALPAA